MAHLTLDKRFGLRRQALEAKGFRLSRTKTEYLEHKFNDVNNKARVEKRIDTQVISPKRSSKYLGSTIKEIASQRKRGWKRKYEEVILDGCLS